MTDVGAGLMLSITTLQNKNFHQKLRNVINHGGQCDQHNSLTEISSNETKI